MGIQLTNNATSRLAAPISSTSSSLTIATGDGDLFPVLGTGDYFFLTLQDVHGNIEIVRVTARAGDTMTVTRGQEGTVAIPFLANSRAELRVTVDNLLAKFDDLDFLLL
jgi:hypothetical protein